MKSTFFMLLMIGLGRGGINYVFLPHITTAGRIPPEVQEERMVYLIAGLACSALVSIVLKACGKWEYDRYGMLAVNYAACLVPFIIMQAGKPLPPIDRDFGLCIAFSAVNGFLYLAGMALNQANVRRNGAILQSAFARLGVMVPTCLSVIAFGERPSAMQAIGILLVLAAFFLMNIQPGGKATHARPAFGLLLLGLLCNGTADSMLKVFEEYGPAALGDWFMGATFIFASIACLIIMSAGKGRIGRKELAAGLALGIPNYMSSLLLLKSLPSVSAYIAILHTAWARSSSSWQQAPSYSGNASPGRAIWASP